MASGYSHASRSQRSRRLDRHDTANTSDIYLGDVDGTHGKHDAKSVASGDVGLLDANDPDRPSDVPGHYVRQVPMVRMREPKKAANDVQQSNNGNGDDHV